MNTITWVNAEGNPVLTDRGVTDNDQINDMVTL